MKYAGNTVSMPALTPAGRIKLLLLPLFYALVGPAVPVLPAVISGAIQSPGNLKHWGIAYIFYMYIAYFVPLFFAGIIAAFLIALRVRVWIAVASSAVAAAAATGVWLVFFLQNLAASSAGVVAMIVGAFLTLPAAGFARLAGWLGVKKKRMKGTPS